MGILGLGSDIVAVVKNTFIELIVPDGQPRRVQSAPTMGESKKEPTKLQTVNEQDEEARANESTGTPEPEHDAPEQEEGADESSKMGKCTPSPEQLAEMAAHGAAWWLLVQHCGWNGGQCDQSGRLPNLFCELLDKAGYRFVKKSFVVFVKVPEGSDSETLGAELRQLAAGMNHGRTREPGVSSHAFRKHRSRLTHIRPVWIDGSELRL